MQHDADFAHIVLLKFPSLINDCFLAVLSREDHVAHGGGGVAVDVYTSVLDFNRSPAFERKSGVLWKVAVAADKVRQRPLRAWCETSVAPRSTSV